MERIAAVTFTEKAGSELRDRLRVAFDPSTVPADALTTESGRSDPAERTARAERALEAIDSAAIGTLHSFAHRILPLHPVEANLPPLIEVLDEVASSVAFDERWSVLQRELLDEPALADAVLLALSAGSRSSICVARPRFRVGLGPDRGPGPAVPAAGGGAAGHHGTPDRRSVAGGAGRRMHRRRRQVPRPHA